MLLSMCGLLVVSGCRLLFCMSVGLSVMFLSRNGIRLVCLLCVRLVQIVCRLLWYCGLQFIGNLMFSSSMWVLCFWVSLIMVARLLCSVFSGRLCRLLLVFSLIIIIVGCFFVSSVGRWLWLLSDVLLLMLVLIMCYGGFILFRCLFSRCIQFDFIWMLCVVDSELFSISMFWVGVVCVMVIFYSSNFSV